MAVRTGRTVVESYNSITVCGFCSTAISRIPTVVQLVKEEANSRLSRNLGDVRHISWCNNIVCPEVANQCAIRQHVSFSNLVYQCVRFLINFLQRFFEDQ